MIRDELRVTRLKAAVCSGIYEMDSARIADAILRYFAKVAMLSPDDIPEALGEV